MAISDIAGLLREFDHTARVDQENLFVVRDKAPSQEIARLLGLDHDQHWIFCGSIGSGKSSELVYLGETLKNKFFVVGLDLPQSINDIHSIQPAEVLMLIGAATVRTVEQRWGGKIPTEQIEALQSAFMGVLDETPRRPRPAQIFEGVALFSWSAATGDLKTAGKEVVNAASRMGKALKNKKNTPLGGLTRPSLREGDPDIAALVEAVNAIFDYVRDEYQREPLVLVDGLDKLDNMDIIRRLFCAGLLTQVRAPSVYCAPITMVVGGEWKNAKAYFRQTRLTNIVVSPHENIDPELVEKGRNLLREVVHRRLGQQGLTEEEVFETGALDLIITESGGVLRNLIQLVNRSIERTYLDQADFISLERTRATIDEIAREWAVSMNGKWRAELNTIKEKGEPSGNAVSFTLLLGNYALLYDNGGIWWAPAPLVARIL